MGTMRHSSREHSEKGPAAPRPSPPRQLSEKSGEQRHSWHLWGAVEKNHFTGDRGGGSAKEYHQDTFSRFWLPVALGAKNAAGNVDGVVLEDQREPPQHQVARKTTRQVPVAGTHQRSKSRNVLDHAADAGGPRGRATQGQGLVTSQAHSGAPERQRSRPPWCTGCPHDVGQGSFLEMTPASETSHEVCVKVQVWPPGLRSQVQGRRALLRNLGHQMRKRKSHPTQEHTQQQNQKLHIVTQPRSSACLTCKSHTTPTTRHLCSSLKFVILITVIFHPNVDSLHAALRQVLCISSKNLPRIDFTILQTCCFNP